MLTPDLVKKGEEIKNLMRERFQASRTVVSTTQDPMILIGRGWERLYAELFGQPFVDVLAPHHREAVEWHWNSRLAFLKGERPEYLAYFPIWSRGHMKSSLAERMVVVDAFLSCAYKKPGFTLYVSREKDKVKDHISNIESLLSSEPVKKWCPGLSEVARNEETNTKRQWTASFLHTKAGYVVKGGSIESTQAGARVDETRPTFIVPDDIDGREDSPIIAEMRYNRLTGEILPMRQENTLVFFAQNLISRYSVMYRIHSGMAQVLTNRKPTEPVPAVIDLVTERKTVNGIIKDVFVSGKTTWAFWDEQRVQDEIDTEGLEAFKKECQHDVEQSKEGVVLYSYDDDVHVITEEEFASVYGSKTAWEPWSKWMFNDWARTKTDKHANVAGFVTTSSQNTKYPGFLFIIHPMSFEANSAPEDVAEALLTKLTPYAYDQVTWKELRDETLQRANSLAHTSTFRDRIEYERSHLASVFPRYVAPVMDRFNVQMGFMSHERDDIKSIYNLTYGLRFTGVNPKKHGGIEQLNRDMRVDYTLPHPFRPEQKGYTRWFVVVPNREYPKAIRPHDLFDHDLFRYQMRNSRYAAPTLTNLGERIDEPLKMDDDFRNGLQMVWVQNVFENVELTAAEQMHLKIPEHLRDAEDEGSKVQKYLWMQKEAIRQREEEGQRVGSNTGFALDKFAKLRGKI